MQTGDAHQRFQGFLEIAGHGGRRERAADLVSKTPVADIRLGGEHAMQKTS